MINCRLVGSQRTGPSFSVWQHPSNSSVLGGNALGWLFRSLVQPFNVCFLVTCEVSSTVLRLLLGAHWSRLPCHLHQFNSPFPLEAAAVTGYFVPYGRKKVCGWVTSTGWDLMCQRGCVVMVRTVSGVPFSRREHEAFKKALFSSQC